MNTESWIEDKRDQFFYELFMGGLQFEPCPQILPRPILVVKIFTNWHSEI
jgi:hypothetical protein